ncbi:hypothetical protein EPUS_07956 [Endocarpon pusillum Z07020]|uniref:BTB domain-containing protein n=1 Tax=Endocarpon pusillum (strain Z07020 / HMAS-L-300199) TaxID=1263415 RepID=U1I1C0_ENDPU|nr:uncharacterized protein EPUS_07956 [Endocarpon pusillum Z07020]ERF77050.1 hypothetical protein EPUS_07956 [Endocarpon pusillum Z07020]
MSKANSKNLSTSKTNDLSPPPAKRLKFEDETVKVFVGHEEKAFIIHKLLVCQASPYFKAALNGSFEESVDGKLYLYEQEPELFNCFVEWVYSGNIDLLKLCGEQRHDSKVWTKFSKLYLLSKYLQCPAFGNCLLDTAPVISPLDNRKYTLPDTGIVKMVYEKTVGQCGIRRYLTAAFVWLTKDIVPKDTKLFGEYFAGLPADCVLDITNLAVGAAHNGYRNPFKEWSPDMKTYHDK